MIVLNYWGIQASFIGISVDTALLGGIAVTQL